MTDKDVEYLGEFACEMGNLFGNLLSLELLLRMALYEAKAESHHPLPEGASLTRVRLGEHVPLNALTSWDSLGELIAKYNALQSERGGSVIDESVKALRDMFAHGRILKERSDDMMTLVKYSKPRRFETTVTVEAVQVLSNQWVRTQAENVSSMLFEVHSSLIEMRKLSGPSD